MKKRHSIIYLIEFGIIGLGFAFLLTADITFSMQIVALSVILFAYTIIGLLHHRSHHDITIKVVIEYILISALVLALFVFLNISKI